MKRKIRIISTAVFLCLVLAIMSVGIYAASSIAIIGNGNLYFKATDVLASVSVVGTNSKNFVADQSFEIEYGDDGSQRTVTFGEYTFTDTNDSISFDISVTNNFDETSNIKIMSTLTASVTDETNFKVEITKGAEGIDSAAGTEVSAGADNSVTYTVTITYIGAVDIENSATFNFNLSLERIAS